MVHVFGISTSLRFVRVYRKRYILDLSLLNNARTADRYHHVYELGSGKIRDKRPGKGLVLLG
jgi:hypothetical protein